jgi:hypothetical protein
MPKQARIKLTYHVKAGEETKKTHKHVDYAVGASGKLSTSRSTIRTSDKAKDTEARHTTDTQDDNEEWEEILEWDKDVASNEEAVDQAYLEHIEETALDEKDKRTRVRPKGVSHWSSQCKAIFANDAHLGSGRITTAVGATVRYILGGTHSPRRTGMLANRTVYRLQRGTSSV